VEQKAERENLSTMDPGQFDAEYMRAQVVDHQKTVQLFQWVIAAGENADLQRLATDMLPTILHHLQMAQAIVGKLTGAAIP